MIIIAPQTTAISVPLPFKGNTNNLLPVTIIATGLVGTDTISLEISADGGTTYIPATDSNGPVLLTALNYMTSIVSAGLFRVSKAVTTTAVGVSMSTAAESA